MGALFYVVDEGPNRFYQSLEEARKDAEFNIHEYRREAQYDEEWSSCVEDICVYRCDTQTDEPVEDGVLALQSTGFLVPNDENQECWDYRMEPRP